MGTYYDELAPSYSELHGEEQEKKLRRIAKLLPTKESDRILDIGCGTGLAARFLKGHFTGIDPSEELLKQCPFPTVKGFAEKLPFPDRSFDAILCVTAIHNFDDPEKALEEMRRVGKDRFVITVLKRIDKKKRDRIHKAIQTFFSVAQKVEEGPDEIWVLTGKTI